MGCTLELGIEDRDVDGVGFRAVPVSGGYDYGSFDDTLDALCADVNLRSHTLRRIDESMYHRLSRVEGVFAEEWTDGDKQQNSKIWLIRRLTS